MHIPQWKLRLPRAWKFFPVLSMKLGVLLCGESEIALYSTVIVLTTLLNVCHICSTVDTPDVTALLVFVCFSIYFALLASRLKEHPVSVTIASVIIFTLIGFVISNHFAIDWFYGASFGIVQGVLIPLMLYPVASGWSCDSMVWLMSVVCTWTVMNYVLACMYGIAVTLPIQLYRFPLILQPISLFGFAFLDAFVIACNCLCGMFLATVGKPAGVRCIPLVRLFILVSVWLGFSSYLWYFFVDNSDLSVQVSTISPGYRFNGNLTDIIEMTRNASIGGSQYIVWPETYISPPSGTCSEYIQSKILPHTKKLDSTIVIGCLEIMPGDCPTANLAITVRGSRVLGVYGKQHPVSMIGESSCWKNGYDVMPIGTEKVNDEVDDDVTSGFATLICYDMDFGDSAATVSDMGAVLILNPSEDWSAARGHFAASVFRAVENRVAVAKCDWGWDSAIIDGMGRIETIYDTPDIHREILTANVSLYSPKDYQGWVLQNVFPLLAICGLISILFVAWKRMRRETIQFQRVPLL